MKGKDGEADRQQETPTRLGDSFEVNTEERARSVHSNIDYLEKELLEGCLSSYSRVNTRDDTKSSPFSFTFTIIDESTIVPTKIIVSKSEANTKTVEWLIEQYFQKQRENPRIDMGNIVCLRTRSQDLNYDYLLTKSNATLDLFPNKITLETYHSENCVIDEEFSSFSCIGLLGSGGFGKVLAVRKKDTGEIYAMKVISKADLQRQHAEVYMFEEKNILMELDSPFVVRLG
jgi:hypothetical protein